MIAADTRTDDDFQRIGKVKTQGTVGGGLDFTIGLREHGFIGVLLLRHALPVVEVTHFHWPAKRLERVIVGLATCSHCAHRQVVLAPQQIKWPAGLHVEAGLLCPGNPKIRQAGRHTKAGFAVGVAAPHWRAAGCRRPSAGPGPARTWGRRGGLSWRGDGGRRRKGLRCLGWQRGSVNEIGSHKKSGPSVP